MNKCFHSWETVAWKSWTYTHPDVQKNNPGMARPLVEPLFFLYIFFYFTPAACRSMRRLYSSTVVTMNWPCVSESYCKKLSSPKELYKLLNMGQKENTLCFKDPEATWERRRKPKTIESHIKCYKTLWSSSELAFFIGEKTLSVQQDWRPLLEFIELPYS